MRDLVLTPSHLALTIHEIVAHPTELDRVVGYEANYAGTSFCKVSDLGQAEVRIEAVQHHRRQGAARRPRDDRLRRRRREDDAVSDRARRHPRRPASNRETAHYIGEKESRGCTQATTWRDYPFLRMPNVHLDPGPAGSPTPEQIIADTKDGVLIEGSGSFSIDQQRYNGQFGGGAFWEIKNGKKTRAVTNVTYNAITTDFWANLDAHRRRGVVAAVRRRRRRERPADAEPERLARRAVGAHPADHGRRRVSVSAGRAQAWSASRRSMCPAQSGPIKDL